MRKPNDRTPPVRLLFVQTQAEMAGAQEISRLLGQGLGQRLVGGSPKFEIHHLFFYRKTDAFDGWDNVHFCMQEAPRTPLAFLRFLSRLVGLVRSIEPDVLLTFQHYGNIFGAPAGRIARVRAIIANHVSAPATIGPTARVLDRVLGLCGSYDAITVNSNQTWRDYAGYPARYRRFLKLVPHGFEPRPAASGRDQARAAFGLPLGVPLIGSVARLHPLKQLDAAIRTLPARSAMHLALAGQGADEPRLRAIAEQTGVARRVHFLGDMAPSRIGVFLAALDVFVFPTLAETFGLAAVEAAQAGVPVVANDLPVLREVLSFEGEPCALFVNAADDQAFGAAIDAALSDQRLAATLRSLGRKLGQRYTVESMVDAYDELINDLLHPGRRKLDRTRTLADAAAPG